MRILSAFLVCFLSACSHWPLVFDKPQPVWVVASMAFDKSVQGDYFTLADSSTLDESLNYYTNAPHPARITEHRYGIHIREKEISLSVFATMIAPRSFFDTVDNGKYKDTAKLKEEMSRDGGVIRFLKDSVEVALGQRDTIFRFTPNSYVKRIDSLYCVGKCTADSMLWEIGRLAVTGDQMRFGYYSLRDTTWIRPISRIFVPTDDAVKKKTFLWKLRSTRDEFVKIVQRSPINEMIFHRK